MTACQVFFSPEWGALVDTSVRNFLHELMRSLPLPVLLQFGAHGEAQHSLSAEILRLRAENTRLQSQLDVLGGAKTDPKLNLGDSVHGRDTATPPSHSDAVLTAMNHAEDGPVSGRGSAELEQRLDDGWSGAGGEATSRASVDILSCSRVGNSAAEASSEREAALVGTLEIQSSSVPKQQSVGWVANDADCHVTEPPGDGLHTGGDQSLGGALPRDGELSSTDVGEVCIPLEVRIL